MKREINLNKLNSVITSYGLKTTNRHREIIWNRYAVYKFLREANFSLGSIGRLFGKNHATVINGLRVYEENSRYSDFRSYVRDIETDLMSTYEDYIEQTEDICLNEMICLANLETLITEKL